MKNLKKKAYTIVIMTLMVFAMIMPAHAAKARLNKSYATITVGNTVKLKVKNAKSKVKWSSSNKQVASVNKKGLVKGKMAGTAYISAKAGKKKLVCTIVVENTETQNQSPVPITIPDPTPIITPAVNEFIGMNNYYENYGTVTVNPCHVYYKDKTLVAESYIINGLDYPVYDINLESYRLFDRNGNEIAKASFGVLGNGGKLDAHTWVKWELVFLPGVVKNWNADLSVLIWKSDTSYNY